jgi:ribose 5-phosphate isomerase A
MNKEKQKEEIGKYAAQLIKDEEVIGLGTGSTVKYLANALGKRIEEGEKFYAVPTSYQSTQLCINNKINIVTLHEFTPEKAFDGADEVDPSKNLIKGRGGALTQEKIIGYSAKDFFVLIDNSKFVKQLGSKFPVPLEVLPLAQTSVIKRISEIGNPILREAKAKDGPVISDNGNFIIDLWMKIDNPKKREVELNNIPGVIENGIFTRKCKTISIVDDVIDVK